MANSKDGTAENGVTITPSKSGATIHIKWAAIAMILGAGGLFGGKLVPGMAGNDTAVANVQQSLQDHCKAQATTESTQREQMVELKTKLDAMREDVRDIKNMLRNARTSSAPFVGNDSGAM